MASSSGTRGPTASRTAGATCSGWSRERRGTRPRATPPRGAFPWRRRRRPSACREDELTATWIGHSTVLLQLGGLNLITDPVFSERAFPVQWMGPRRLMEPAIALEALPPLDLILISHSHYDHLDRPAVRRLAQAHPDASWVVPLGLGALHPRLGRAGDHRARLVAGGRRGRRPDHRDAGPALQRPPPGRPQPDALVRVRTGGRRPAGLVRRRHRVPPGVRRGRGAARAVRPGHDPDRRLRPPLVHGAGACGPGRSGARSTGT